MNKTKEAAMVVRTTVVQRDEGNRLQMLDLPPRSQLYGLSPLYAGTLEVESLTSYVNRLAWAHGVSPRKFLAEMLVLNLTGGSDLQASVRRSGSLGRVRAMRCNGAGEMAWEWSSVLEHLTVRSDLRSLTLWPWAHGLPQTGLVRKWPAWCPACYQEWQDEQRPLYQPLLWMLQAVTICPRHQRRLEELCPFCHKHQSAIATQSRPGFCTQCLIWLGSQEETEELHVLDLEGHDWQTWVVNVINDFFQASISLSSFPWERLATNLAACFATRSEEKRSLIRSQILHSSWFDSSNVPSFPRLLEVGYALNISPLQFITSDAETLSRNVQINQKVPLPQSRQQVTRPPVDRKSAKKAIDKALQPRKRKPPLARSQLERQLGLPIGTLRKWFPRQAAQLTTRYREYCAQRSQQKIAQQCKEVRQAAIALHERGINPRPQQVALQLSHPGSLRSPEVRAALSDARRELGLES
jgi:hypothetical protein